MNNTRLSTEARDILATAKEQSQKLHHDYIGTEHLLLALLTHAPTVQILKTLHLDPQQIRSEIQNLIRPGPDSNTPIDPSLTPRAQRALELAAEEIAAANQKQIDPPHILLALLREAHGIAAVALQNLHLDPHLLREQVFRIRLMQLRIIERTVRPIHAGNARKLKMREELLAHLESIYEQELARTNDPGAAITETAQRFGDPLELSHELQSTIPAHERLSYLLEKRFGWRAPESAPKYLLRLALQLLALLAIPFCILATIVLINSGWTYDTFAALRPAIALLIIMPLAEFLFGLLYFETRDALFGAFGKPKSPWKVALLTACTCITFMVIGVTYVTCSTGNLAHAEEDVTRLAFAAIAVSLSFLLYARTCGPAEILHTHWSCLNLDAPAPV